MVDMMVILRSGLLFYFFLCSRGGSSWAKQIQNTSAAVLQTEDRRTSIISASSVSLDIGSQLQSSPRDSVSAFQPLDVSDSDSDTDDSSIMEGHLPCKGS